MLIKRTHLFLEILLGIFIAYLLLMRLAIVGLQSYPQQSLQFLSDLSGWQFKVSAIELEQTWLGAKFELSGLEVDNPYIQLQAEELSGDINIFAPMIPVISFGEQLNAQQVSLRVKESFSDKETNESLSNLSQLNSAYRDVVDFLRSQNFTRRCWQKITIDGLVVNDFMGPDTAVQVDNLDLIKASQINLITEFGVRYHDVLDFERFNLRINLSTNSWGGLDFGSINLVSYEPLQVNRLAELLPVKWAEILPAGELLLDWHTSFQDAELADSVAKINAQALQWQEDDEVLPNSVGIELRWNPRLDANLDNTIANFELVNVQLDNQFVKTLSPVQLRLYPQQELELLADRFDISPFKDMLRVFVENDYLAELLNQAVELDVTDFVFRLNWQTLEIPNLRTRFARLGIPLTDYPGVATQNLSLVKQGDILLLEADEPIWVLEPKVHPLPVKVSLPKTVVLNYSDQRFSIDPVDFSVDRFRVSLESFDVSAESLSIFADIKARKVKDVLAYLPYGMFGEGLNRWLVNSNVAGENPNFKVSFKGSLAENNSNWLSGLSVVGSVDKASLKFDKSWPKIEPSDIDFEYRNCELSFDSEKLNLQGVSAPAKARVKFSDLSKKDIALNVQASVMASVPQAVAYLAQTPLPKKVGLDKYMHQNEAYAGHAKVTLADVWIPISGFKGKEETVVGSVRLQDAKVALDGVPEISKVDGDLSFTEKTLKANKVKALLFDNPAVLDIATDLKKAQMNFTVQGSEHDLSREYFAKPLPFQLTFSVPTKKHQLVTTFSGRAQVQQAQSLLPYPFSVQDLNKPLSISGQIGESLSVSLSQPDVAKVDVVYSSEQDKFISVKGYVGKQVSAKTKLSDSGSYIHGDLGQLSAAAWLQWWNSLASEEGKNPFSNIDWHNSYLNIDNLNYKNQSFTNARVELERLESNLKVSVKSNELEGSVFIPEKGALNVQIERAVLKSDKSGEAHDQLICAVNKREAKYPEVNVLARNVQFDSYPFELVRFSLEPNEYGYATEDVSAQFSQGAGVVTANYRYDQNRNLSAAEIDVSSKKLQQLMKYLGVSKGVTSKQADIHAEIAWFGGFECFTLNGLFGRLNFKLDEGVVEDVEPGVARLLGLLSVDSLARRLKLNLDDVTNEGLIYDDIKGKAILNNSKLQLVNLDLDAPAVKVAMLGLIDMQKEEFALKANVTPSVGSSLPTIAALAGVANPIAALAVYTVMKVLPDINENLITYRYKIDGPWKEPKIELVPQAVE
ncbi:hypothetical protein J3998_08640 [Thiomicrorhabdus sp. 6S2-11]|uniref:YhdP central domain-containing protein n=1 Tax=Thiomicrorhabdus marina TaxID=2818442 RepID=A0ABS3Q5P2_9GAMM|nr:AsmA-like C-terminal region-containing protein [Thiomicrorhabdus marina]MBO1927642.1 hypothetical protein [Thiomicrorhabdus marina]